MSKFRGTILLRSKTVRVPGKVINFIYKGHGTVFIGAKISSKCSDMLPAA